MTLPRLVENFEPLIVRYSLDTISSGKRARRAARPCRRDHPRRCDRAGCPGQITEWKTMLSLPMK